MHKRLISMVLALSMALSALPLPALAQSAPPDTASAEALAEQNDEIIDIYDNYSGKPSSYGHQDSWEYNEAKKLLTLKSGTFRLRSNSYSGNRPIQWNVKIEAGATLQDVRIGEKYDTYYTVTNAGTISGGTFYAAVTCEDGAVISGGEFKIPVTVDAAGGKVTIDGGTFENGVTVDAVDTLTINGGTFKGGTSRSVEINGVGAKVVINGGSFENVIQDVRSGALITINSGLFQSKVIAEICEVNGGLFTAASDPLSVSAFVKGGYFVADHAGDAGDLVAIDAHDSPVFAPVAVEAAAGGKVTEWSADAYDTLYTVPETKLTLKVTRKLTGIVSDGKALDYTTDGSTVTFTIGTAPAQLNSITVGELVIEANGFPKGTEGGIYEAYGDGWSFDPDRDNAEIFGEKTPTLIIGKDTTLDFDKVTNKAGAVKFAVENNGVFTGTLKSDLYVYNREGGILRNVTLDGLNSLYNDGLVEDSVLRVEYIGNGWRETAQPATIRNSALDIIGYGWLLANSSTYKAVLDGCYNSADYTGTATIDNGGTVKNSKNTLKLVVKNIGRYDGNGKPYQPVIDGGEYTVVYNEDGIIQNAPTIHALVAKDTKDLNGATDYYTLKYTAPEDATYFKQYINGINGMIEGIWSAKVSTLYVDTDQDTISVITHAPIKSVNGVTYNGSVPYDEERYTSTIDLSKYNIPQTRTLNLSATDEGVAALPDADPADFAFTVPANAVYDGEEHGVTVRAAAGKGYGNVTVTYISGTEKFTAVYDADGVLLSGKRPVNAGDYTFTAEAAATDSCAGGDVTPKDNKFTIQKAELKATDFNILVSYTTMDGENYTLFMNDTDDPSDPPILFYGDEITGYKIVSRADPAPYTAAVMGNYYMLDDNGNKIGTSSGTPTKPGHYRLSIRVTADANHYVDSELQSEKWVLDIRRAPLYISDFTVTEPELTYDGTAKAVTVTNNSEKDYGEITVTYRNDPYNSDGAVLDGAPVEPGVYYYTVNAAGGALYAGGLVASGSFRIKEAVKPEPEPDPKPEPEPEPEPDPKPEPEPEPEPEKTYPLTVNGADITLPEGADATALKAGQLVSLTACPDTAAERFDHWLVSGSDGRELTPADLMDAADEPLTEDAFKQRTLAFKMPVQGLNITAVTTPVEQQPEESGEFDLLETVNLVVGTAALYAGIAVVGYEAVTHSILAELLPKGTPIPTTREQLAVLLWNTAGKPEPTAPAVYSDVTEPETAKAARWAVEAGLLPDKGEGVFAPGKRVTKVQVIRALNRLKKLGLAK